MNLRDMIRDMKWSLWILATAALAWLGQSCSDGTHDFITTEIVDPCTPQRAGGRRVLREYVVTCECISQPSGTRPCWWHR